MGVGIIANMAYSDEEERDLVATDARGLFGTSYSHVAIRKDKYIRPFIFSFIEMLAPHLTEDIVIKALRESDLIDRKPLLKSIALPFY
jgi:LysR family cys regulon transcriptional activator